MLTACSQGESRNLPANTLINASHNQQTTMDDIYPSLEKSHPKAKALKNKDWYYDPVNDMAPFGSDDAADTYAYFYEWRQSNKSGSPKTFVLNHFNNWVIQM